MPHLVPSLFIIALCCWSAAQGDTITVSEPHALDIDEHGRQIVLAKEGDTIEISCENSNGGIEWEMPDNRLVLGYDEADREARVISSVGHDVAEQKLTITEARVSDTGSYGCKYAHHVHSSVYVYVRGAHFFLKTSVNGFEAGENFTIPCRATWIPMTESQETVRLLQEGQEWNREGLVYDPVHGFNVTKDLMATPLINRNKFECAMKEETSLFFISPKVVVNTENFTLVFEEETEFPHVGGAFNYSCALHGHNVYYLKHSNRVNSTSPRSRDNGTFTAANLHGSDHVIRTHYSIDKLTAKDAGSYVCKWWAEVPDSGAVFKVANEVSRQISVSPIKEQIKMLNRTVHYVEVNEGAPILLSAHFRLFPDDHSVYSAKWTRLFVRAHVGSNESEIVITDDAFIVEHRKENGTVKEKVAVQRAKPDMNGIYVLAVGLGAATRRVEWQVRVKTRAMIPRIEVASQDKWILFDQSYYSVGAPLRLVCYIEAFPKAEVHLKIRKLSSFEWDYVEDATAIEGTYTKGYTMNVTAIDDVEYKCEGRRDNRSVFETKTVRVSDSATDAKVTWHKPQAPYTAVEETDHIYEGDRVELECIVPKSDNVTMRWVTANGRKLAERTQDAAHSKHLIATIEYANIMQSGDYTCVVRDVSGEVVNLTRTIEVTRTTKPFMIEEAPDANIVIKYGDPTNLTCYMGGAPVPIFKWLKDGVEVTDQLYDANRQLHIPRAAVEDVGTYACVAENRAGETTRLFHLKVRGAPKQLSSGTIILIILAFLVLLGCLIAAFCLYTRQRKTSKEQARSLQVLYEQLMRGSDSDAPPLPMHGKQMSMDMRVRRTAYDPKYEIDLKNLVLMGALGSGQFGSVRKGRLARGAPVSDSAAYRGPSLTVAIKSPKNGSSPADQKALIDELKILIAIDNLEGDVKHPNVLSLVGAVTRNMKDGQLFVVFEMCEHGDLKTFLQKYKTDYKDKFLNELREVAPSNTGDDDYLVPSKQHKVFQYITARDRDCGGEERDRLLGDPRSLSTSDLISFSMQIASGMDFLSGVSCIHRDLAARNCLLTGNKVVKIADFGMAKNEDKGYYRMNTTNVMVPYRWMAPESMEEHTFSVESDVWSFGIVLYEIFTLGAQPYPGVPNNSLHEHLMEGHRNPRPSLAHPDIYTLMLQTWDRSDERRPSFAACRDFLRAQLQILNPELLDNTDREVDRNAAQIAQFDQFRGPRATVILDEREMAALFAGQSTPTSNGGGGHGDEETGERIYIKELRR